MISVGQTVGNYKITAKLGEGGMGIVYLAEHPVIGRKVAMKAIHPELSRNPEVVSRFMTEAKSVNQIGNEHIVDIIDFGNTPDGEFYFLMEFLQGESLADRLKREHAFAAPRALKIAAQVADALASSHEHGIIHRDLKPENIYLINRGTSPDFVKVLDFGLAKLTQGEEKVSHKTRTGSVMGTPYYMSPEQCEGKANVDHRVDVYSLGVILFEMLTGKVPFGGEGYGEIIVKHITQPPPSVRAINPLLLDAHDAIVRRSLAKSRDDRFASMGDFRTAMLDPETYALGEPAHIRSTRASSLAEAKPVYSSGEESSGQVVFGGEPAGARSRPIPTTFGQNAGELLDEPGAPRSRKGLIVGALGAAAIAGVAAFYVMRGGATPSAPQTAGVSTATPAAAPPAAAAPPVTPDRPDKVRISFDSDPKGAQVVRVDTNQELGTTPFAAQVPFGSEALVFAFRKAGFQEETLTLVPDRAEKDLLAALAVAQPAAPLEPKQGAGKGPAGANGEGRRVRPAIKKAPAKQQPLDEDDVLTPTFK